MKILFIGHAFHRKTQSSSFFIQLLKEFFEVEVSYVDPADPATLVSIEVPASVDLVVLWQMDFLAPLFLARGLRTVVVPMYDGSSLMPDLHWVWAARASFVNFSRRLDENIRRLGLRTLRLKYFSPAVTKEKRPAFDSLRVFLWQRRPEEGINLHLVETLFGNQVTHVHIHDVADNPDIDTSSYLKPSRADYKLTTSRWLKSKADYARLLTSSNVYIAPRRAEGIGLSFLEAMARGMLVVAADAPTHDEYVANWINGVLFNPNSPSFANFDLAGAIAEAGWQTVVDGYRKWRASLPRLIGFLQATPAPQPVRDIDLQAVARGLVRSYLAGVHTYSGYLLNQTNLISQMSGIDLHGRLTPDGRLQERKPRPEPAPWLAGSGMPWLAQNRLDFGRTDYRRHLVGGTYDVSDGAVWLDGRAIAVGFRLDLGLGLPTRLRLEAAPASGVQDGTGSHEGVRICATLNGWTLGFASFSGSVPELSFAIPPQAIRDDNVLQILIDGEATNTVRSVGLRRCVFE